MQRFRFVSPKTVDEACLILATNRCRLLAGGTDVIPKMRHGGFPVDLLVDLAGLDDLRFIREEGCLVVVGALATHMDMIHSALLQQKALVLVQAASMVGAYQTQNRGTLGGNIANASPAGDTLPALLALNASVTLISQDGERTVSLQQFLLGPGKTGILLTELIKQISFAGLPVGARCGYEKMGKRNGMSIAVASAAAVILPGTNGTVQEVRLALGSVASTPIRCPWVEAALQGCTLTEKLIEQAAQLASQECSPISDIRSTADYRRSCVSVLVRRVLQHAASKKEA
jgi:CO/xanthine dehydrogenase FAD-binding subunit